MINIQDYQIEERAVGKYTDLNNNVTESVTANRQKGVYMDNKNENIIENEIEVQVKEDNGAVLEYAKRLAKFNNGKGDKMDDEK